MKEYKYEIKNEKFLEEFQKKLDLFESETIKDTKLEEGKSLQIGGVTLKLDGKELTVIVDENKYKEEGESIEERYRESEKEALEDFVINKKSEGYSISVIKTENIIDNIYAKLREEIKDHYRFKEMAAIEGLLDSECLDDLDEFLGLPSVMQEEIEYIYNDAKEEIVNDIKNKYDDIVENALEDEYYDYEDEIREEYSYDESDEYYLRWFYNYKISELPEKSLALIDVVDQLNKFEKYIAPVGESLHEMNIFDVDIKIDKMLEFGYHVDDEIYDSLKNEWISKAKDSIDKTLEDNEHNDGLINYLIKRVVEEENILENVKPESIVGLIPLEIILEAARKNPYFGLSLEKEEQSRGQLYRKYLNFVNDDGYFVKEDRNRAYRDLSWDIYYLIQKELKEKYPEEVKEIISNAKNEKKRIDKAFLNQLEEDALLFEMGYNEPPSAQEIKDHDKELIYGPDDEYGYDQYNGYKKR